MSSASDSPSKRHYFTPAMRLCLGVGQAPLQGSAFAWIMHGKAGEWPSRQPETLAPDTNPHARDDTMAPAIPQERPARTITRGKGLSGRQVTGIALGAAILAGAGGAGGAGWYGHHALERQAAAHAQEIARIEQDFSNRHDNLVTLLNGPNSEHERLRAEFDELTRLLASLVADSEAMTNQLMINHAGMVDELTRVSNLTDRALARIASQLESYDIDLSLNDINEDARRTAQARHDKLLAEIEQRRRRLDRTLGRFYPDGKVPWRRYDEDGQPVYDDRTPGDQSSARPDAAFPGPVLASMALPRVGDIRLNRAAPYARLAKQAERSQGIDLPSTTTANAQQLAFIKALMERARTRPVPQPQGAPGPGHLLFYASSGMAQASFSPVITEQQGIYQVSRGLPVGQRMRVRQAIERNNAAAAGRRGPA